MSHSNSELFEVERLKAFQAHIEKQERDIGFMIGVFESEKHSWKSFEEVDAFRAQCEINDAQQKLRELRLEIEKQEAIIREAEKAIRKFKRNAQSGDEKQGRGRPAKSEERKIIVKRFVSQWVASLMGVLEVTSCQKLEQMVDSSSTRSTERNWRRWLKGEAIPTYSTFVALLNSKIEFGKYAGELLQAVPTSPKPNDLLTILRFI